MTTQEHTTDGRAATTAHAQEPAALREQLFYPTVDGTLFDEAVRCFEHGAYRAALVMTWLTVAEGIRHRFNIAAQQDRELTDSVTKLKQQEEEGRAIDSLLLDQAKRHGMINRHEHKDLAHIRDQRNRYAHPSGESPTEMQVLAALEAGVRIVLSRPALHRKEWAATLVEQVATDRTFYARDPDGLRDYARDIDGLLTDDARQQLVRSAIHHLNKLGRDPARSELADRVAILAGTILAAHPDLVGPLDLAGLLRAGQLGTALVCLQPEVFETLDNPLAGAALANLLDPPTGAASDWQPDVRALITVQKLAAECRLTAAWADRLRECIGALPLNELIVMDIPAGPIAARLVEELEEDDRHRQNSACRALASLGPGWCSRLIEVQQWELGMRISRAAEDGAMDADWLLGRIARDARHWPFPLILGVALGYIFDLDLRPQLNRAGHAKVEAMYVARNDRDRIIAEVCAFGGSQDTPGQKALIDDLKQFVDERPSKFFSAVLDRLTQAPADS